MNWFKKSIVYDQKRKLLILPILMLLIIVYNIMNIASRIANPNVYQEDLSLTIGATSYFFILCLVGIIALVSVGIRDKSERSYMVSMPIKRHNIILTKLACAVIAVIVPIFIGFLIESGVYVVNRTYLVAEGYPYLDVFIKYFSLAIVSLTVIGGVYILSLIYNNIKVPVVLVIIGVISSGYLLASVTNCFHYNSKIRRSIEDFFNYIADIIDTPGSVTASFYPSTIGRIIVLIGIVVLLFTLIDFVAGKFSNDVYDNLFSFKISKILSYIALALAAAAIFNLISGVIIDILYFQPRYRSQVEIKQATSLFVYRAHFVVTVILTPLWIFIASKINKKLEERF
ncbi:hypothetical protein [Clostridium cylindrosporum]|uniref:ABC-2 family transporter protein n=1 Tax=Clostridium cylindrosporum DSM 605 TaxID=1121307 RepID=A0A0J8DDU2_CLOCY|nr:hypothetical protein [Clostridium cylindrosporum]KMT22404.1 hypothetical protein CLCY_14c00020 [Clostridium cylindrosporum DSM 605]